MSSTTDVRNALADALAVLVPSREHVNVLLAPTDLATSFGDSDELKLLGRIIVGEPSDAAEALIDELFDAVPKVIHEDRTLGGAVVQSYVTHCSGHRFYPNNEDRDKGPMLGAEWTVKVMTKEDS